MAGVSEEQHTWATHAWKAAKRAFGLLVRLSWGSFGEIQRGSPFSC